MKIVYKEDIKGFLALPTEKQDEIEKLAKKQIAKPKMILMAALSSIILATIPLLQRKWENLLGEDAYLTAIIVASPFILLHIYIHNTMLLNPRIKDIVESEPNQGMDPTKSGS